LAKRHQVTGLVDEGLRRVRSAVPLESLDGIGAVAATVVRENLAIARESLRLQHLFDDAGLSVLFVKGTALAMMAYGNISFRSAQDIDLLVDLKTLPEAMALISREGYSRLDPPPEIEDQQLQFLKSIRKDFGFVHQDTGIQLELHWRLFLNPQVMGGTSTMFAASQTVQVTEKAGLRTLGEQALFSYLCMHGALHWWYRLKWLADINALLTAPQADIERLYKGAQEQGVGRAAAQGLLLCRTIFGMPLPDDLVHRLTKSFAIRWLENTALNAITCQIEPRKRRFGTTRGSMSTFLLNKGCAYHLAELKTLLINQQDVLRLCLPKWLWFVYPFLRLPLWAWRHFRSAH
jgi:hypothetical protein